MIVQKIIVFLCKTPNAVCKSFTKQGASKKDGRIAAAILLLAALGQRPNSLIKSSLERKPMMRSVSLPFSNRIMVGMVITLKEDASS